jgi:uncharacterized protein
MTVVDQASRVPQLDEAAISRLAGALDSPEVVAAFLFGSQARGTAGPLSDVDVAILHADGLNQRERLDLRLALAADAGATLGTQEIDVVLLNGAPPLLRHRVLRDAIPLVDRTPDVTRRFRETTERDYVATESQRKDLALQLRRRVGEGSFGRRP